MIESKASGAQLLFRGFPLFRYFHRALSIGHIISTSSVTEIHLKGGIIEAGLGVGVGRVVSPLWSER